MKKLETNFIPNFTTEAGRSLTVENWQEVGVNIALYDLKSLLMKPGLEQLSSLPDLATYTGWPKDLVLNAAMPAIDKDDGYTLRSEYDGSRRRYTLDEIITLIAKLKPQIVLLPEGSDNSWQSLPETILPFFAPVDLPKHADRPHGVYFLYDTAIPFSSFLQQIHTYSGSLVYVGGELSVPLMQELAGLGVQYLASDVPARDACHGAIYCQKDVISLKNDAQRLDFSVIDEQCNCPTCEQKLTRAYLHHLIEHTPLLCQRLLILHNVMTAFKILGNVMDRPR